MTKPLEVPDQPASNEPDAPPAESGRSIFTAIEEQLGLRLEPRKAPVEAIVIQSVEKAENRLKQRRPRSAIAPSAL